MNISFLNKLQSQALLAFTVLSISFANAQESVNTAGSEASGSEGTASFSIGQITYNSNQSTSGQVAQGVQQAYEIYTISLKEEIFNVSLEAYPNPVVNNLTIRLNQFQDGVFSYELFNTEGRLLRKERIREEHTEINSSKLPASTYLLYILNSENHKVKFFKIIKH